MSTQDEIKNLQELIAKAKDDIDDAEYDISRIKAKLLQEGLNEGNIDCYIEDTIGIANDTTPEPIKNFHINSRNINLMYSQRLTELDSPCQLKGARLGDLKLFEADLQGAQDALQEELSGQVEQEQPAGEETPTGDQTKDINEATQEGHLYPVAKVQGWTAKLQYYNDRMDAFLKKIEGTSVNVNLTWLCKTCEAFCRRINYAIALLRYEIIKGLSGIFKPAQEVMSMLDPIVNANPADLGSVIKFATSTVNFFMKPYQTIIQFVSDFMSYTPPLVSQAGSLVGKAATVPVKLAQTIHFTATDKETGEVKPIAETYQQYIDIKMEPITLGDVMGGGGEKPVYAEFSGNAEQYKALKQESENNANDVLKVHDEFATYVEGIYETIKTDYEKVQKLYNDIQDCKIHIENCEWQINSLKESLINYGGFSAVDVNYFISQYKYVYDTTISTEQRASAKRVVDNYKAQCKPYEGYNAANDEIFKIYTEDSIKKAQLEEEYQQNMDVFTFKSKWPGRQIRLYNDEGQHYPYYQVSGGEWGTNPANTYYTIDATADMVYGINNHTWGKDIKNKYKVYGFADVKFFAEHIRDTEAASVFNRVSLYYEELYGKANADKLAEYVFYVSYVESFKDFFPEIPVYLDKWKNTMKTYMDGKQQLKDLQKRSIFK